MRESGSGQLSGNSAGSCLSRRQVVMAGAGLVGAAITSGIAGPAMAAIGTPTRVLSTGGKVVVYSGRSENLVAELFARFAEQTGIETEVRYAGTAELAATILEEGKNSPADLFFSQDAGALGALEEAGLFADLTPESLALVEPRFRSRTGQWVGVSGRARVAVYNPTLIEASAIPTAVKGFTAPEWQEKVGWAPSNGSFQSFITAFRVIEGEDAARDWLEAMKANGAVTFENNDTITIAVGEGELPLGLVNHYYKYEIQAERSDLPVENFYFDGGDIGSLVNVAGVGLLKTAKNGDQGNALIDFLLGADGQGYFAAKTWEYPLVDGMAGPAGVKPLAEIESPDIDLSDLSDLEGTLSLLTEVGLI